ncbi:hypothetical protein [Yinghuangia soli]|uniref:Uncharacterized protein n=1 Tax=Yinghuangia soli TaxID=2908204 RepID=A0AA41TZ89_9ACTN|nr:hypothetical protein [Yinghuangia soli]MCF2527251.1 hypothetical protein [Yinghuangia soli]
MDPIILARIRKHRPATQTAAPAPTPPTGLAGASDERSPYAVAVVCTLAVVALISWSALITGDFYRPDWNVAVFPDLWDFASRSPSSDPTADSVPYLRDYPSWILTASISASVPLVFGIYVSLQSLHESLDKSHCIKCDDAARVQLKAEVDKLNKSFERHGKYSWLAILACAAVVVGLNLRMQGNLFSFLETDHLYDHWWARLAPFSVGGLVWVLMGTVGMYMVYAEAVVGIRYVGFLKRVRDQYKFGTNPLNPDNFYGWLKLRQAVTNLQGGVICTVATAFGMFFFLQPAIGSVLTVIVLGLFIGMVLWVFVASMTHIRKAVAVDRQEQIDELIQAIGHIPRSPSASASDNLHYLVTLKRLRDVQALPSMPINKGVLLASALSVLAPTVAIVVQIARMVRS